MMSRPPEGTIELGTERGLRAAFAPHANMVLHSLTLGGRELLAQRNGLEAYAERGSTMGVPLLHPWANRLAGDSYGAAGVEVELPAGLVKRDPAGLPIHGAPPGTMRWELLDTDDASLSARLDWDAAHPAFEIFPFPHRLEYRARLSGRAIEIAVTLTPTGERPVPVSFGFHPYLRIQAASREAATIDLPVRRRLVLDDSMIPTGESEPFERGVRVLGDSSWDDGFAELASPPLFLLAGGEPEVALTFLRGYPFAQVFAPPGSDFVCFEPMTAPANALVSGGAELPVVAPGDSYDAAFEIAAQ